MRANARSWRLVIGQGTLLMASALFVHAGGLGAQDARLTNTVDTTQITLGDRIVFTVSVDHDVGANVVWPDSILLAPFEVLDATAATPVVDGSRMRSQLRLTLTAFELGELELPSFEVLVTGPGPEAATLETDRFGIEVVSVGQDEGEDIRDIRGPLAIPVGVVTISLWLLVGIALAVLAWWLWRRFRAREESPPVVPKVPPRPADVLALEALDAIEASDLLERGEVKSYHIQTSDVLRRYVEARFDVPALEMTTREVLRGLTDVETPQAFREDLRDFLDRCDLVKFAKVRPDAESSNQVLQAGRTLVRNAGSARVAVDIPTAGAA